MEIKTTKNKELIKILNVMESLGYQVDSIEMQPEGDFYMNSRPCLIIIKASPLIEIRTEEKQKERLFRKVTRSGITVNKIQYYHQKLIPYIGTFVYVEQHGENLAVYDPNGPLLCTAIKYSFTENLDEATVKT